MDTAIIVALFVVFIMLALAYYVYAQLRANINEYDRLKTYRDRM
jgi:hypothetical protein